MHSILGFWASFCMNDCINVAWHGGDQFVALLRCNGSPGCFDSGLQVICIVGSGVSHLPLNNNNNNLLYIELFWVLKTLLHRKRDLLNHYQCAASTWMMRRQPYWARTPTTHQLIGGEETQSDEALSVYGDDEGAMMIRGHWVNLAWMLGLHPYSFLKDILGF